MFAALTKTLAHRIPEPDADLLENAELIADCDGNLTVRPLSTKLGIDELQHVVSRLREAGCDAFDSIRFDFSRVQQLVGPWGTHFASLVLLKQGVHSSVHLEGLQKQPSSMAWLFRHSKEVQQLLMGTRVD